MRNSDKRYTSREFSNSEVDGSLILHAHLGLVGSTKTRILLANIFCVREGPDCPNDKYHQIEKACLKSVIFYFKSNVFPQLSHSRSQ